MADYERREPGYEALAVEVIAMAKLENDYWFFNNDNSMFRFWYDMAFHAIELDFETSRRVINRCWFGDYEPIKTKKLRELLAEIDAKVGLVK